MAVAPIAAIEIGTSRVRTLVGEELEGGQIIISGIGDCVSRGVRKGEISNFEVALASVVSSIEQAEEQSKVDINEVHLVVTGGHLESSVNRGATPVLSPDNQIGPEDVERAMEMGRAINLSHDRAMLHSICQHFYVDDQEGILSPMGLEGARLAVDMLIIHGIRNRIRNSVRVLKSADVEVRDVAFSGLCNALAVLTAEQKESGVVVIDIGGGTTDYIAYAGKAIAHAGSIAVGGDHVTNDAALGLKIPTGQAEKLKRENGSAIVEESIRGKTVSIKAEGGFPGKAIRLHDLQTIMNARMDEVFTMIRSDLEQRQVLRRVGAGIILTGGGAHMRKVTDLARQVFGMPCEKGLPRNVSGLAVVSEGPDFAAPVGMVRYGFKTGRRETAGNNLLTRLMGALRR